MEAEEMREYLPPVLQMLAAMLLGALSGASTAEMLIIFFLIRTLYNLEKKSK